MNNNLYIADPEILNIPSIECNEPVIDIKHYNDILFGTPPEHPSTEPDYIKIRESVYRKICEAQRELPQGLKFRLYEGYRSLAVQKMLFDQQFKKTEQKIPNASYEEKFHETTRLVSPVLNLDGSINIPPHNTAGAIDIEIIDSHGNLLDMGMTAAQWVDADAELCATYSNLISDKVQQNRIILLEILEAQGFVNYSNEWWHFSYGDRYWAYYQHKKLAMYGAV